jgi:hypothetical protein
MAGRCCQQQQAAGGRQQQAAARHGQCNCTPLAPVLLLVAPTTTHTHTPCTLTPCNRRRLAAEVEGDVLGDEFKGYVFKIMGGQDKQVGWCLCGQRVVCLRAPCAGCDSAGPRGQRAFGLAADLPALCVSPRRQHTTNRASP